MKITPLEIRQKDFEKKLRGYDKDEVNAFLQSLSNEWERVLEENKDLNLKLQQAEKEVKKLREVESSLYKTLKTAEDTGANVIEQANKAAELHMKETKMNAEALLNESKNKARAMIEQAEVEARQIIEELQDAVKSIEQNHRDIENHRQMAIQELKNLSVALIEKVERNTKDTKEFRFDDYVKKVKQLARDSEERIKAEKTEVSVESKNISLETTTIIETKPQPAPEPERQASVKEEPTKPEPPKTEELRERIIGQRPETPIQAENEVKEKQEQPKAEREVKSKKQPVSAEEADSPKKEQKSTSESKPEKGEEQEEEKKGPRISKTVSFFDELDTES
ncbi:MAG: hypothetical protein Tsb0034_28640 [Ekhidna sp.]